MATSMYLLLTAIACSCFADNIYSPPVGEKLAKMLDKKLSEHLASGGRSRVHHDLLAWLILELISPS